MAASLGLAPRPSGSKPGMLLLHHEAKLVEPEVVATSPNRIKSPVPVCCGFGSANEDWSLPPVLPRHSFLTKKTCRLLRRGKEMVGCHGTAPCSAV